MPTSSPARTPPRASGPRFQERRRAPGAVRAIRLDRRLRAHARRRGSRVSSSPRLTSHRRKVTGPQYGRALRALTSHLYHLSAMSSVSVRPGACQRCPRSRGRCKPSPRSPPSAMYPVWTLVDPRVLTRTLVAFYCMDVGDGAVAVNRRAPRGPRRSVPRSMRPKYTFQLRRSCQSRPSFWLASAELT